MKMRIATWNMGYWQHKEDLESAWDFFLESIDADILFFQEARPTDRIKNDKEHLVWNEIGGRRDWGSGVYSKKYELSEETIETDFRGVFTIANTKVDKDTALTLISLYGLMTDAYSITNLHRMLSDLTFILNGKRKIVLGGDLNASVQFDPKQRNNSHKIFFDRLEDFKLEDCFKKLKKRYPVQTLRKPGSKIPWQNDYFFISKSISKRLVNCEVIGNDLVRKYSDHNPVIITLDF
jgi:exodeoxyribonuclease-3